MVSSGGSGPEAQVSSVLMGLIWWWCLLETCMLVPALRWYLVVLKSPWHSRAFPCQLSQHFKGRLSDSLWWFRSNGARYRSQMCLWDCLGCGGCLVVLISLHVKGWMDASSCYLCCHVKSSMSEWDVRVPLVDVLVWVVVAVFGFSCMQVPALRWWC